MDTTLWIQIIASIAPTLMALAALIAALKNRSIAKAALIESARNGQKIQEVHLSLNSRLSELLTASVAQGRIDEQNHQSNQADKTAQIAAGLKIDTAKIAVGVVSASAVIAKDLKADTADIAAGVKTETADIAAGVKANK